MMVSVAEVVNTHEQFKHLNSLSGNLGDGYLYHHNPVFRNIRDVFLASGGRFTLVDFCHYRVLSLAALPKIVENKTVPFLDNFTVLAELERKSPHVFNFASLPDYHHNYLHHESAHCIADFLMPVDYTRIPEDENERREMILKIVMAESFANSCDMLGNFFVSSDVHRVLYDCNSFVRFGQNEHSRNLMSAIVASSGLRTAFKTIFLSYLFVNFLYEDLTEAGKPLIMSLISPELEINSREARDLFSLFTHGKALSKAFVQQTSAFYLKHLGFKEDVRSLLDFNFLAMIYKNDRFREKIDTLTDFVESGAGAGAAPDRHIPEISQ